MCNVVHGHKRLILTVAAIVVASVVFICYLSQSPYGSPPLRCGIKALTGYVCPGCGSQRAFQALLHGDLSAAWGYNAFALIAAPVALFWVIVESGRDCWPGFYRKMEPKWVIVAAFVATIAWWVVRNL